jgi:hypothetical protein
MARFWWGGLLGILLMFAALTELIWLPNQPAALKAATPRAATKVTCAVAWVGQLPEQEYGCAIQPLAATQVYRSVSGR